jgi:hypothetical protein
MADNAGVKDLLSQDVKSKMIFLRSQGKSPTPAAFLASGPGE